MEKLPTPFPTPIIITEEERKQLSSQPKGKPPTDNPSKNNSPTPGKGGNSKPENPPPKKS